MIQLEPAVVASTAPEWRDVVSDLYRKLSLPNIPALDGIRAVAITLVVMYHFDLPPGTPGPMGVTMFFVLSGFLITWLLLKEADRNGSVSLPQFYKRRFLRIFPAFYSYWAISVAVLYVAGKAINWREFLSAAFYVSNYYYTSTRPAHPFMPFTWSLAVEEQFYLLWPGIFCLFVRDLRALTRLLCGIIVSVWVYRIALYLTLHPDPEYLQHAFDTRADHLMIGALLAVLLRRRVLSTFIRLACASRLMPAVSIGLLAASVGAEHLTRGFDYRHTIGYIIEPILIVTLLVQMVSMGDAGLWGWINWRPTRFLGRLSYSWYLYHFTMAKLMLYLLPHARWRWQLSAQVIAGLLAACGSYYIIERPFLRLKRRSLAHPAPSVSVVALQPVVSS